MLWCAQLKDEEGTKINSMRRPFFNTQGFRIGALAVLAVALLAGGAFWFGPGLRADTAVSVAPASLRSSLTNVRESQSVDYVGRLINSAAAVRSASAGLSNLECARKSGPPAAAAARSALPAESRLMVDDSGRRSMQAAPGR